MITRERPYAGREGGRHGAPGAGAGRLRDATSTAQRSTQASPTDVQQALEAVHQQAAAEILALHAQLQTHLTLEELQHAQALMHELDAIVLGASGGDLEQRIRAAAINRLVKECAPLAWQTLLTLMARAQVAWPDPAGLSTPCRCARRASGPAVGAGRPGGDVPGVVAGALRQSGARGRRKLESPLPVPRVAPVEADGPAGRGVRDSGLPAQRGRCQAA
jgi:hypothetical protein